MKKLIALLLALCMVFALVACSSSDDTDKSDSSEEAAATEEVGEETEEEAATEEEAEEPAEEAAEPEGERVLKVGLDAEPTALDPDSMSDGQGGMFVSYSIFATLWMMTADGETNNVLAESYGYNDDGSEFTIVLRDDIYFADGNPITAEDVLYTFELENAGTGAMRMEALDLDNAVIEDDRTLTVPMAHSSSTLVEDLNIIMIREKAWCEQSDENLSLNVMASGAYAIESWETGMGIVLTKNDYYFDKDNVYYDRIEVSFITSEETRLLSFENGDFDIICLDTSDAIDEIAGGARADADIVVAPLQSVSGIAMNVTDFDTFQDQNVRQAVGYAIDTESLVNDVLGSAYTAASSSMLPSSNYAYLETGNYSYDLDHAKELMEEAGYSGDNRLSFTLTVSDTPVDTALAEAIQYMLSQAYMDMSIDAQDGATYMSNVIGNTMEASFSSYMGSYEPAGVVNSRRPGLPAHLSSFADPDLVDLLEECCTSTASQEERVEMWHELQERAYDYANIILLYESNQNYAVADSVDSESVIHSVQGDGYLFVYNLKAAG